MSRHLLKILLLWAVVAAATLLGLDAFWLEPDSIRLSRYDLTVPGAEAGHLQGLRIAVIADLHAGAPYIDAAKIRRIVAMTNAAHPDLILMAGDYIITDVVGGRHMPIEFLATLLHPLSARLGVYAVMGNHDYWENAPHISQVLRDAGIPPLENQSLRLGRNGITLVGMGDTVTGHVDPAKALAAVAPQTRALCFTHSPDIFAYLSDQCLLTVAGHTHGGQINLPFFGPPYIPSAFGDRYAKGFHQDGKKYLFVSTGIGTSEFPVRFRVPPEISLLTIH